MVFPVGEEVYPQLHDAGYQLTISAPDSTGRGAAQELSQIIFKSKQMDGKSAEELFRERITGRLNPFGDGHNFTEKFDLLKTNLKTHGVNLDSDQLKTEAAALREVLEKAQKSINSITIDRQKEIVKEETAKAGEAIKAVSPIYLNRPLPTKEEPTVPR